MISFASPVHEWNELAKIHVFTVNTSSDGPYQLDHRNGNYGKDHKEVSEIGSRPKEIPVSSVFNGSSINSSMCIYVEKENHYTFQFNKKEEQKEGKRAEELWIT